LGYHQQEDARLSSAIHFLRVVLLLLLTSAAVFAQPLPAGTEISIRLKTPVSTALSQPNAPVEAVIIAPVESEGRTVIAAGSTIRGKVEKVTQPSATVRAALLLQFTELQAAGTRLPVSTRVAAVDNARETVDGSGQINGILTAETLAGRLDDSVNKVGESYSGLAGILSAAKDAVFQPPSTGIQYPAGVEMMLRLEQPLDAPAARLTTQKSLPNREALLQLAARQPFQTAAQRPPMPSDLINLMLVGSESAIRRAFQEAGWSIATKLNSQSKFDTLRALAEDRGFQEAPVSLLLLDGKPPSLVFEKSNNTFARRHHARLWRRAGTFHGKPVWLVAATHDTAVDFLETERLFIHRIDSQIDRERQKIVNDLLFTGRVATFDLADRPAVPSRSRNATGDPLETDGRLAILLLH
jgi:LssY C-terminus